MTASELINSLTACPQDMSVVVNGYEDGNVDLSPDQISSVKIALNRGNHRWEGKHRYPNGLTKSTPDSAEIVEALGLQRESRRGERRQ